MGGDECVVLVELQDLADRLLADGLDPSTVRNALMPARAIFRRGLVRGEVAVNPVTGLELPAVRGKRDRIASPEEARQLLDALPAQDRPLWSTAVFAGLRLGEARALRWSDIDLASGVIRVERSWDPQAGPVEPKSHAGRRSVPIPAALRDQLIEHKLGCVWSEGLVFGRSATRPFCDTSVGNRARRAFRDAKLTPITLHEARHTYASLMIDAGVNAKQLSVFMGHANISITLDRYGHLMPGAEAEAASMLDSYLERADTQARIAQVS